MLKIYKISKKQLLKDIVRADPKIKEGSLYFSKELGRGFFPEDISKLRLFNPEYMFSKNTGNTVLGIYDNKTNTFFTYMFLA